MAEKIEEDDPSWSEVQGTLILTVATSALFLTLFEIARRHPKLVAIYDRRRNTKPHRTPPPLLKHVLMEWLFVSNEPRYVEYSDLSHMRNVIVERRRQRNQQRVLLEESQRRYRYGNGNGNGGSGSPTSGGLGYNNNNDNSSSSSDDDNDDNGNSSNSSGSGSGSPSALAPRHGQIHSSNPYAIEVGLGQGRAGRSSRSKRSKSKSSSSQSQSHHSHNHNHNHDHNHHRNNIKIQIQSYLTPNVVQVHGRRLPKEMEAYALANDLSEEQLEEYEQRLIAKEQADEVEYMHRVRDMKWRYEKQNDDDINMNMNMNMNMNIGGDGREVGMDTRLYKYGDASSGMDATPVIRNGDVDVESQNNQIMSQRNLNSSQPGDSQVGSGSGGVKSSSGTSNGGSGSGLGGSNGNTSNSKSNSNPQIFQFNQEEQNGDVQHDADVDLTTLVAPKRPNRFFYLNFQQGDIIPKDRSMSSTSMNNGAGNNNSNLNLGRPGSARALSPRSLLSRMTTLRSNRSGGSGSVNGRRPLHTPAGGRAVVIGQIGGGSGGGVDVDVGGKNQAQGQGQPPGRNINVSVNGNVKNGNNGNGNVNVNPNMNPNVNDGIHIFVNRHLKSTSVAEIRPLTESDAELLRCIGLDTFVMIRFLRFCFDVTWYPFLLSVMVLVPTYYGNEYDGVEYTDEGIRVETQTDQYFRYTMNRLQPGSPKLWVPFGFMACFVMFLLRRLWIEWETFIVLRFDFMANGDVEAEEDNMHSSFNFKSRAVVSPKDDVQLHLEQYRNSCLVEYIPESHRRDRELFQFFDAVFPNQVKRAEILLNASSLEALVKERQAYIEQYETIYAKHQYAKQRYHHKVEGMDDREGSRIMYCLSCKCLAGGPKKPDDPTLAPGTSSCLSCCRGKKIKAMPYLLQEIKRLNRAVDKEHRRINIEKKKVEDQDDHTDFVTANMNVAKDFLKGTTQDLRCSTGFVEFKTLTAKQSALQCNLTGTNGFMVLRSAPDPRDMLWQNATVEHKYIKWKKLQMNALLFTGTLFWSIAVFPITVISDLERVKKFLPSWLVPEEETFWYNLVEGYIPVIMLELLMLVVPWILRIIATKYIRFKTHSETDQFIYKWHFAYRVANLIIIVVKHQVMKTLDSIMTSPQATIDTLAAGIAQSSQFFLNNMLIAAGTETLFELSQLPGIISHIVIYQFVTIKATSKRTRERMRAPISLEWGDTVPKFIFSLLIGTVYCTQVPIVTGACAVFFYIAVKVYTHQALFIYAQPYEGGGKLMYQLNRSVFAIVYTTNSIFSVLLSLKGNQIAAASFFLVFNIGTLLVDRRVTKKFITPGLTLALTNARLIDEEIKKKEEVSRAYVEYKAMKMMKMKEASRAANILQQNQKYDDIGASSKSQLPPRPNQNVRVRHARFKHDVKNVERPSSSHSKKKVRRTNDFSDSDDDSLDGDDDFYLYRQPHLNRSQWETKPRPYHG